MEREDLYKEIDLIQGCISRMANCSFIIKGLALTVFSAVLAITQETVFADPLLLVCTVMIPFCCFWILDAIFLKTEKEYRLMYKWVIRERKLNNEEYLFDLNPERFRSQSGCFFKIMFSKTLLFFYGIPMSSLLAVIVLCYAYR